ncbi:DUF3820 family protein [Pseudoduganella sp. S-14]|jgi:uncharacterized protein|uniref:DUF3820 family protein n=1 Tax=Pseudoduganella sp. S-14 TaxID=3404065 RepID=UPI003CEE56DB
MNPEYLAMLVARDMPYGKYKGRKLADLPGHYLGWMAREGFPKGELGALLALMYEIDHNNLRALLDPLRTPRRPQQPLVFTVTTGVPVPL